MMKSGKRAAFLTIHYQSSTINYLRRIACIARTIWRREATRRRKSAVENVVPGTKTLVVLLTMSRASVLRVGNLEGGGGGILSEWRVGREGGWFVYLPPICHQETVSSRRWG